MISIIQDYCLLNMYKLLIAGIVIVLVIELVKNKEEDKELFI
jgi:hypothetical protein